MKYIASEMTVELFENVDVITATAESTTTSGKRQYELEDDWS